VEGKKMRLNLPIELDEKSNVLIAGAGGGFDVFAGLPLSYELRSRGHVVRLFNYSFTDLERAKCETTIKEAGNCLYGFEGDVMTAA
jgi:hypothetical protein